MHLTACVAITWPSSFHPVETGAQKTVTNTDFLATSIAGSNKLSFVSDLGLSGLLTAMKLWQANFTVLDIQ